MKNIDPIIRPEQAADASEIDTITSIIFGPGMKARAAYFLREGVPHEMPLSFVALINGAIVGSVRLTKFNWGGKTALMLGPLGVLPQYKGQGIGKNLMHEAVSAAKASAKRGGAPLIMLVGDLEYYQPFGFAQIAPGKITLPRPADPNRILSCELLEGVAEEYSGPATR